MSEDKMYLFRRRGFDDWCSCDRDRYEEFKFMQHVFDVKIVYDSPRVFEVKGVVLRDGNPTLIRPQDIRVKDIKLYMLEYNLFNFMCGE